MIKIRIRNAEHETDLRFPISESELFAKLGEIHALKDRDSSQAALVSEVYWPEEFTMLKDRYANLDELNYLAKRMESFFDLEMDQFLIGISKMDNPDVKGLINLTFNLNRFTLCKDVSSYGKIGREYVLNTEGSVPANDEDDPKYAAIGKELIEKGHAQITEKGLLIYNPLEELEEVYDGQTFPEYYYRNSLLSLNAEYNGRTELLQLPDEVLAIKKAIERLGAPSAEDCDFAITLHNIKSDEWTKRIENIISEEGVYDANNMLKALDKENLDWDKLSAVMELADVGKSSNIALLAERLDEFGFIARADSERDVGQHFVYDKPEYSLHADMEDFFDFKGFGEHIALNRHGQFVSGGFVYYDGNGHIDDVLDDLEPENQGMTMGVM
ncbi:antirestriction protein ArdA [Intestinimonas massiliensis]|uniref:Antirestriction protein ArdA n=2 Tax=Intestinimonas massiliensis (ex Afouda et al. 2020) TaxID=1673721 RepID=A0AAW5JJN6_9FIRM|nr:antirestriction protein ArdA [Intestinimonas massiliensis (ex Afouda et al. 2020)]